MNRWGFLVAVFALVLLNGCGLTYRIVVRNVPGVTDYRFFEKDTLEASSDPQAIPYGQQISLPAPETWALLKKERAYTNAEELLAKNHTNAFLVIRNDSIIYESYFNGYQPQDYQMLFSVTKSMMSALTGIAIEEGYIQGVDQPVSDFIPEFGQDERRDITIGHLLQMTSGLAFDDYKTLLKGLRMYYNRDASRFATKIRLKHKPGTHWAYSSHSTMLLGMCIERATGMRLSDYFKSRLWDPLRMEREGYFATDRKGNALAYGGIAASAHDMAKFGLLYLHNGKLGNQQIVPAAWTQIPQQRDTSEGSWWGYQYCWWLDTYYQAEGQDVFKKPDRMAIPSPEIFRMHDYFAAGFRGQYIYVNPDLNIVIIRQGSKPGHVKWGKSLAKLASLLYKEKTHHKLITESKDKLSTSGENP